MNLKHALAILGMATVLPMAAQEDGSKFFVNGKADLVSDYVWRGAYQGSGVSVQPSLTMGYGGLSLNVWGNQSLSKEAKEFDINLSYTLKNFTLTVSDYWWTGVDQPYGHYDKQHFFEGTLAYTVSEKFPLTLSWSTMFAGADKDEDGDLRASTYVNASYPFALPLCITLTPSVGFTPWKGMYWDKAGVTDVALKASKDIVSTEHFTIPLYVQAIVSPVYDRTYLVAGMSIGF